MKKIKIIIAVAFVLTSNILAISGTASDQVSNASFSTGEEFTCKWSMEDCLNGGLKREVCIRDGDGNTCTCGDVSRSC